VSWDFPTQCNYQFIENHIYYHFLVGFQFQLGFLSPFPLDEIIIEFLGFSLRLRGLTSRIDPKFVPIHLYNK